MECVLCRRADGDAELFREQVWEDELWRLSTSIASEVTGFSYLEPKRHVPHVEDLDGAEATTFGAVLAHAARVLKEETGAERVFVYVFGEGVPHLHVHLAPHREGDALNTQMIRGNVRFTKLPSGAGLMESDEFPPLPEDELRAVAERVRRRLADEPPPGPPAPLLPWPMPAPRTAPEPDPSPWPGRVPEIPPLPHHEPDPDDPRPDRPADDPWYGRS